MASQKLAAERSRLLLGCYRRIDAIDPDTWVLAIAAVLSHYDDWVIVQSTHPRTGIQATEKFKAWPPNSGELIGFCDDLVRRAARYAYLETLPKPIMAPRLPPPADDRPGRCANLFVAESFPHYDAMVERSKISDPKDWCWFRDHSKYGNGIKIPADWYPARHSKLPSTFQSPSFSPPAQAPTNDELSNLYRKKNAAA